MEFNFFDYLIITIFMFSTLFAVLNGFIKTLVSLLGWIGSVVVAILALPIVSPIVGNYVSNEVLVHLISVSGTFIVAVLCFALLNSIIYRLFSNVSGGIIDRSLGLLFGILRATVFSILIFLSISLIYPVFNQKSSLQEEGASKTNLPEFLYDAKSYNFLNTASSFVLDFIPDDRLEEFNLETMKKSTMYDKLEVMKKLTAILPYGDSYVQEVDLLSNDINYGSENLTKSEKEDLISRMLEDYFVALDNDLLSEEEKLSKSEIAKLKPKR